MSNKKSDMEEAAKAACRQFDMEHGSLEDDNKDDYIECPCGCGKLLHKDEIEDNLEEAKEAMMNQSISAKVETVPGTNQVGVIAQLPDTKQQALLLLLGIINTMCIQGEEEFDYVIAQLVELDRKGAMNVANATEF